MTVDKVAAEVDKAVDKVATEVVKVAIAVDGGVADEVRTKGRP